MAKATAKKTTTKAAKGWRNRIVASGELPANQFLAHESNARRHPAKQRAALRGSLNELGWIEPVIVSNRSGKILDGHARIEEALSKDEDMPVPFVEVDVTAREELLILATLDPITNLADYDKEALDLLLQEVATADEGLQAMLSELAIIEGITSPDFQPVGVEQQGRLDEKVKVTCPECGAIF